jgi:redox-sensitive bicupin YhaK (pirin superfamily)
METKENTLRSVGRIVPSQHKQIGILPVRTPSVSRRSKEIDPFLQLDHIGPVAISTTEGQTPDYLPHKGFEMLTYLIEGYMEHTDSQGNHGILQPGDVQLLRTGRGSMHYENNKKTLDGKADTIHKVQLWINLPGRKKQSTPSYQYIPSFHLPTISLDHVLMKVLAGEWNGESSPLITGVPVLIMHLMMEAGAETEVDIPLSYQAGIYVLKGYGLFGEEAIDAEEGSMVLFNNGGETIRIKAPASRPLEILLLSGKPIGEPIVTYGPFVMNNIDEIYEAMVEYSSGQFGSIVI